MKKITEISSSAKQSFTVVTEDNFSVKIALKFIDQQSSWFLDVEYGDLAIRGKRVALHPNSLRQFRKQLPFGIAFVALDFTEPFRIDDFASDRVQMIFLAAEEVDFVEDSFFKSN